MKSKSLAFAIILFLGLISNAQRKPTTGAGQPTSQNNVDKYSAYIIFKDNLTELQNDPEFGKRYFWKFDSVIMDAFKEGKTDMKAYTLEWARLSGLSQAEISDMVTEIYLHNQLNTDTNSNSDKWTKNQLTMKGFGLSSALTRQDAQLIASASEEKGTFLQMSDSEKLALLNRLPKEYLQSVLSISNILQVESANPAIANWLKENASEKVKASVAQSIIRQMGGLKFDPSYLELVDPTKMDEYAKCSFALDVKESIEKQKRLCKERGICDSISAKFRAALQNKLNYFPSKMNCANQFASDKNLNPSTLLNGVTITDTTTPRIKVAPADLQLKSEKCGMQKSDTVFQYSEGLKGIAKMLFRRPGNGERSMSSGTNGDTSRCLFMSTLKLKKNGEIELQVNGIGQDNLTEVTKFKFKDKIDFDLYIASLEADARKKLKGSATTSPVPVTSTAPATPRVNANPWVNK